MLGGIVMSLSGVALGLYLWLYWKWWSKRHENMYFYKEGKWWWLPGSLRFPIPDQLSPKRRKIAILLGEAAAVLIVVMGVVVTLAAVV